jgi:thiol-disulfide isomerase/thioredoxin
MRGSWVRFWNKSFCKACDRFMEHFDRFHKLDNAGRRNSATAKYWKFRMWTDIKAMQACHLICRLVEFTLKF